MPLRRSDSRSGTCIGIRGARHARRRNHANAAVEPRQRVTPVRAELTDNPKAHHQNRSFFNIALRRPFRIDPQ